MSPRRSGPEHPKSGTDRSHEADAARNRLVRALRSADLDDSAPLDDNRTALMGRLMRHSNDDAATTALVALDRFTAAVRADAHSGAPDRLLRQGRSGTGAVRRRLHRGGSE
jgi:hypothetical protein